MSATGNSWKRCAIAPRKYKRRKIKRGRGAIAFGGRVRHRTDVQ
ncbi:MAG: hypothetical protein V7K14_07690 [Nostoc sp.]